MNINTQISLAAFVQGILTGACTVWIIWFGWDLWPQLGKDILAWACNLGLRIAGFF